MTKLFFDTEFTGLHQKTTLLSIGIVSECGKTFYAEFLDYDESQIDDWLKENVLSKMKYLYHKNNEPFDMISLNTYGLNHKDKIVAYGKTQIIKHALIDFLSQFDKVEMWSDCLSYDWVLFNNIFGTAFDIPANVYYIPFDICTLFKAKGIDPDISREEYALEFSYKLTESEKHNALWDANIIKKCYNRLMS